MANFGQQWPILEFLAIFGHNWQYLATTRRQDR